MGTRIVTPLQPRTQSFSLEPLRAAGKTVIGFYEPTCHVCRQELPELPSFPDKLRLVMVSESSDHKAETAAALGFPQAAVFFDCDGLLLRSFAMAGASHYSLVDEGGVLRDGLVGAHGHDLVQRRLREFAARS